MNTTLLKYLLLSIFCCYACNDLESIDFLEVTTLEVTDKTKTTARLNGKINDLENNRVERYGFVWSATEATPTELMNDGLKEIEEPKQSGTFFIDIENLLPNKQYYVRAYAQLEGKRGLVFGETVDFMTNTIAFNTMSINYERGRTLNVLGSISGLGNDISINQHGHVWSSTNKNPTLENTSSNLGQVLKDGSFTTKINDLQNQSTYYIRAYLVLNSGKDILYEPVATPHPTVLKDIWEEKASLPDLEGFSAAPGFVIDGKFYVVKGAGNKFWKYDPSDGEKGTWTDLENPYPGRARDALTGFAIEKKGYVGLDDDGDSIKIWEYDPYIGTGGTWTKSSFVFPGEPRNRASSFVLNKQAYIIAGHNYRIRDDNSPSGSKLLKDVYRFDPKNGWKKMNDFRGEPRNGAMHFAIGNRGYVMGGNRTKKDVWEYNPNDDTWSPKKNFPGGGTEFGTGLSINNKGYVGTGISFGLYISNVFWEYNPNKDTWTKKEDVPGDPRAWSISFTINNKGYLGLGAITGSNGSATDLWEYTPE